MFPKMTFPLAIVLLLIYSTVSSHLFNTNSTMRAWYAEITVSVDCELSVVISRRLWRSTLNYLLKMMLT